MATAKSPAQTRQKAPRRATAPAPVVSPPPSPSPPTTPLSRFSTLPEGRNPNRHTERGLRMLEDAIQQDGYVAPMTATADGTVIDGNARLDTVAHALPSDPLVIEHDGTRPIVMVRTDIPNADDPRAQRIIVGANRIAEVDLDWDAEVLKRMQGEGVDLSRLWGEDELADLLGLEAKDGLTDPDAVPELRKTDIVRGDLFQLGQHRLLCGDSTSAEDVARVMGGEKAQCIFTDPPYGVAYDGGAKKRAALDNDHVGTDIYAAALPLLAEAADDEAALYLWYADGHAAAAAAAAAAAGYQIVAQVIWAKNHAQFVTSAHYKGKHEPCYYAHKRGQSARWHGPNNEVTLWECDRSSRNDYHPTQKPVELANRAIANSTASGQVVIDGFRGGGTTIIACEQLNRRCYAIEIEPAYVQVAIDRWEAFTGKRAVKYTEAAGG